MNHLELTTHAVHNDAAAILTPGLQGLAAISHRPAQPRAALFLLIAALAALAACGDDPRPAPSSPPDAGLDASPEPDVADPDAADPDAPDPDADDPDPGLTSARVAGSGAVVKIDFEPFTLSIEDAEGALRARTVAQGEGAQDQPPRAGLAFARAAAFNPGRYYNPTLQANERDDIQWFVLGAVVRGEQDDQGARFEVASTGADGAPGPQVQVSLAPAENGVTLRVILPDEEAFIFTSLSLEAREGEGYFGFGEVFDRLDGRGLIREMQLQATGDSESGTNEVHVPVPFMISTERFGVFLDDKRHSAFDLGATAPDVSKITAGSRDTTWNLMVDSPMGLVERYTAISGRPARVPFWALAPQWWRNVNRDAAELLDDVRRGRAADIPSTVVWIDRPWSSYYHNWRFNLTQFPDPEGMFEALHDQGHRVLLHHSPQLNPTNASDIGPGEDDSEGLFDTFAQNGWLVQAGGRPVVLPWGGGRGGFIDYSHPEAVEAVKQTLRRVTDLGAIGTKMDWDEFLQANAGAVRINVDYFSGLSPLEMRIRYSALYHKAIIEGFNEGLGEQSFHVSRSGTPGDQVWSTCIWPGDLDNDLSEHTRAPSERQEAWNVGGMPAAIVANQSLGMSGYPCFASDIGGFRDGAPDEEVLLRWLAFGVFNAITQLGGGGSTHMAWSADSPYSPQALDVTRKLFKLRMSLVPYIHHHLEIAHATGRPLVRSLWLAFPDDPAARDHERDFLFGPDLLVAPVFEAGVVDRALHLPPGRWVDFWSGQSLDGPADITRPAPIDMIPLLIRAGAIIPMLREDIDTLLSADDTVDPDTGDLDVIDLQDRPAMRVLIVPGEPTSLTLYNGLTVEVAPGPEALTVDLRLGDPDPQADPRISFAPTHLTLEVFLDGAALQGQQITITRGGQEITLEPGVDCTDCLDLDPDRNLLRVHLASPGRVTIR